jgi:hypothetical protein
MDATKGATIEPAIAEAEPGDTIECQRKFELGATVERTIIGQGAPPPPPPPGDPPVINGIPGIAKRPNVAVAPVPDGIPGIAKPPGIARKLAADNDAAAAAEATAAAAADADAAAAADARKGDATVRLSASRTARRGGDANSPPAPTLRPSPRLPALRSGPTSPSSP